LWDDDGAALLAAASILHAGLPRRAAVAAHVRAMEEPSAVKAGGQHESPGKPVSPGGKDTRDPTAGALLAELRRSEVTPRGQLIRLTRRLPVELASQLLSVLDGGPALLRAEAVRALEVADPRDPATPALAMVVLGWLAAAEQALAAGGSVPELRVLLGVADQEGNLG
jgi:hypothetical protein